MATLQKLNRRGQVVIPARLRKKWGIEEGDYVDVDESDRGILLRPAGIAQKKKVRIETPKALSDLQRTPTINVWRSCRWTRSFN